MYSCLIFLEWLNGRINEKLIKSLLMKGKYDRNESKLFWMYNIQFDFGIEFFIKN